MEGALVLVFFRYQSVICLCKQLIEHFFHSLFCRDGGTGTGFTLSAGFPPKDVLDAAATVADAGLLGAAVTQKAI